MKIYYNQETGLLQTTRLDNKNIILSGVVQGLPYFELNVDPVVGGETLNIEFLADIHWITTQPEEVNSRYSYDGNYLSGDWLFYPGNKVSIQSYPALGEGVSYSGLLMWSLVPGDDKLFQKNNNGTVVTGSNTQKVNYYDELYQGKIGLARAQEQAKIDDDYDLTMTTGIWLERSLPESEQGYRAAIPPAQYQSRVIDVNPDTGMSDVQEEFFEGADAMWQAKRSKAQKQRKDRTQQELTRLGEDDTLTLEQELALVADYEAILEGVNLTSVQPQARRRGRRNR